MTVEPVPLLALQRDLYRLPRDRSRFEAYLRKLVDPAADDLRLPLFDVNPMAREHVPAYLDALLAFDAEGVAAAAVADVLPLVADLPGRYRFGLAVVDDRAGGWTNRFATDAAHRFDGRRVYSRGWCVGYLWTSEEPTPEAVRSETRRAVLRLGYELRHGPARTLADKLRQEGAVLAAAGGDVPTLDPDDLAYTRAVIAPLLAADDLHTTIAVLFGDAAGATLGFPPTGLSPNAGLAVAVADRCPSVVRRSASQTRYAERRTTLPPPAADAPS